MRSPGPSFALSGGMQEILHLALTGCVCVLFRVVELMALSLGGLWPELLISNLLVSPKQIGNGLLVTRTLSSPLSPFVPLQQGQDSS